MRKVILIAFIGLAALIVASRARAQGTMLFTWHGASNYFQATFEITEAEWQPGARWTSDLFMDSMSVNSLSGATYHGGDSSSGGTGGVYLDPPDTWYLAFQLNDFSRQVEVLVSNISIREKPFSGPNIYFEPGYWTYQTIPEPSVAALSGLGLLIGRKIKS